MNIFFLKNFSYIFQWFVKIIENLNFKIFFPMQNGSKQLEFSKRCSKLCFSSWKLKSWIKNFSYTKLGSSIIQVITLGNWGYSSGYWKISGLTVGDPNSLLISGEVLETRGIHNLDYWKIAVLLLSGELLETGGIHNSGYGKIAGQMACYFQGNSWRLGASIIGEGAVWW